MNKLLLDTLPIWITAQAQKTSNRGISASNQQLLGIQKLRELILELAIQGKLVPQDTNDEPASELLKKIEAEKKRLIKEGKIRKQSLQPEIKNEEKPFKLSMGWELVRLQSIIHLLGDGLHGTPDYTLGTNYYFINGNNLVNGKIEIKHGTKTVSYEEMIKYKKKLTLNSVLVSINGTLGNVAFYNGEDIMLGKSACYFNLSEYVFKYYIKLVIESPYFIDYAFRNATGTTIKNLGLKAMNELPLALPPLAEQHRIVAKVDELMALCDELEKEQTNSNTAHETLVEILLTTLTNAKSTDDFKEAWERIAACFDTLFTTEHSIDKLKKTILQLAIMGKLVPQDPNEEPASELLKKIAKEKARLVKEGKIKKQTSLPEITEEEKPFELPEGWEWVRLSQIGELARGKSKHRPRNDDSLYVNGIYPMVQTGDVAKADRFIETYTALYNEKGLDQSRLWPKGTMCITIAANIADTSILGFDACFPDSIVGLIVSTEIGDARYFDYFVRTAKNRLTDYAPSTAQKNINLGILESVLVPLPPLDELNLIVTKVDELFALCDNLKERIREAKEIQNILAEEIVRRMVR